MSAANDTGGAVSTEDTNTEDTGTVATEAEQADAPARPVLRVVGGDPSPEDLAALTVVLAAASGGDEPASETGSRSAWNDPVRLVRRPVRPGPDGWRASTLPG